MRTRSPFARLTSSALAVLVAVGLAGSNPVAGAQSAPGPYDAAGLDQTLRADLPDVYAGLYFGSDANLVIRGTTPEGLDALAAAKATFDATQSTPIPPATYALATYTLQFLESQKELLATNIDALTEVGVKVYGYGIDPITNRLFVEVEEPGDAAKDLIVQVTGIDPGALLVRQGAPAVATVGPASSTTTTTTTAPAPPSVAPADAAAPASPIAGNPSFTG